MVVKMFPFYTLEKVLLRLIRKNKLSLHKPPFPSKPPFCGVYNPWRGLEQA